ncbi:hypothetical protein B296_00052952 [Ensete ventricosum]|uniref:Uncharacterized protein n=1 Tax=Ensete ventricosum TaxID=4639 RepID=A0A426WWI8_ENSVE|nr:hypothetical protein B296_00052952 [Ensete ventricosum]
MHPLRFPNSGIKAKFFMRQIGFKLRVMRLYRIESFYALLLGFRSEGAASHNQPPCRASHPRPAPMQGQPPTARPKPRPPPLVVAARKGSSPQGLSSLQGAAARGQPCRLRRGNDNGGVEGDKERLGRPFEKRMILPL